MTFDYTLGRSDGVTKVAFTVDAPRRDEADRELVDRMLDHGFSQVDLLYWHIVSVVEVGRRP